MPKLLSALDDAGVKRITFNRPERRNPVDFETFELLAEAVRQTAEDGTRVLILTGAGDAFCAGADLQSVSTSDLSSFDVTAHLREHTTPTILALRALGVPVIARVHGPAVGIGFSYALASDLVVASEQATFGMGFVKIGLMPDGGSTELLPRLVGYHKAFELMSLGEQFDAREALRLGVVNHVVPESELDGVVDQLARRLARSAQPALARIKQALNRHTRDALAAALDFEAVNQNDCLRSPDFLEGVTAFVQKRPPNFGRS
ncbi:MAG TPA: enoyl-CoA hydratase [Pyrinomonadaceae bacterium]|nr:enoyl-CoA hydratase [Pyrinomonadaceae bacterium]